MSATWKQPPSIERDIPATGSLRLPPRAGGALAAALGFFGFMPYPALPVGAATAIQMGDVLTVFMVSCALVLAWKRRSTWMYLVVLAPLCVATLKVAIGGQGDLVLSMKVLLGWGLSCVALVAAQIYAPRYSLELLSGIAAATLVHVAIGLWQLNGFSAGYFPLVELYVNPSFLSVQNNVQTIVKWIQRPFGLFPEPSAMSSSLAPWVILWTAIPLGIARLRREAPTWQRLLFAVAAAGGLLLIILSQSGHTMVTLAALAPLGVLWLARCKATVRSYAVVAVSLAVVLPLLSWMVMTALENRISGSELGNSSWEERATSLRVGFELLSDGGVGTVLFGMGPGQSSPAMWDHARLEAVWSVLLTYFYETGLVGAIALALVAAQLTRVWKVMRFDATFAAFGAVWLVGITLTTSYWQLLPIWIALGWLTVWPSLLAPASREAEHRAALPHHRTPLARPAQWGRPPQGAEPLAAAHATRPARWLPALSSSGAAEKGPA